MDSKELVMQDMFFEVLFHLVSLILFIYNVIFFYFRAISVLTSVCLGTRINPIWSLLEENSKAMVLNYNSICPKFYEQKQKLLLIWPSI